MANFKNKKMRASRNRCHQCKFWKEAPVAEKDRSKFSQWKKISFGRDDLKSEL